MKRRKVFLFLSFGSAVLLFFVFVAGIFWFGGRAQFLAFLNGESVYFSPRLLDLGSCEAGAETVVVFKMSNLSSKEISVIGERSSCNCAFSKQLPIVAASGKTVDVKINVRLPRYDSSYDQTIILMVAEPNRLAMHPVRVKATIPNPFPRPVEGPAPTMAPPEPTEASHPHE